MFSNFKSKADIRSTTPVKSSAQRNIKTKLVEAYPGLSPYIDDIVPKKSQLTLSKCEDRISLYSVDGRVIFFQSFDDDLIPALRIVHLYPDAFTTVRVDRGAIKFVLSGANIMAPGMTSAGGMLPDNLDVGKVVVVLAEGKEHAVAVGVTKMTSADMREKNKGHGVDTAHYLGDWLVRMMSEKSIKDDDTNQDSGNLRQVWSHEIIQCQKSEEGFHGKDTTTITTSLGATLLQWNNR